MNCFVLIGSTVFLVPFHQSAFWCCYGALAYDFHAIALYSLTLVHSSFYGSIMTGYVLYAVLWFVMGFGRLVCARLLFWVWFHYVFWFVLYWLVLDDDDCQEKSSVLHSVDFIVSCVVGLVWVLLLMLLLFLNNLLSWFATLLYIDHFAIWYWPLDYLVWLLFGLMACFILYCLLLLLWHCFSCNDSFYCSLMWHIA